MPTPLIARRSFLISLVLPLGLALSGCGGGGGDGNPSPPAPKFVGEGLEGRIVARLRPGPSGILAATDDSAFRRSPLGWAALNLKGYAVLDITALSPTHLMASVRRHPAEASPAVLMESHDAGVTWHAVAHDFGGPGTPEPILALVFDGARNRLLASGADALAVSLDFGRHWQLLAGHWQGFATGRDALAVDPANGDVWYGGQDATETLVLNRRRADGSGIDFWSALLPNPSVAKAIRFAAGEPGRVLVSGEGGIVQTRDAGRSWQTLLANGYRFHFDVLQDPGRPRRLVSASWEKDYERPQPLAVHVSEDHGATWRTIAHPSATLFGGAWSAAHALDAQGRSVFLFGLYRGGVMRLELD